jgi:hypothetical protein
MRRVHEICGPQPVHVVITVHTFDGHQLAAPCGAVEGVGHRRGEDQRGAREASDENEERRLAAGPAA